MHRLRFTKRDIAAALVFSVIAGILFTSPPFARLQGLSLDALTTQHAKLAPHLRDSSGKIRSFVNIYLNDEDVRFLPGRDAAPVKAGDVLTIVPSIAGGVL
jgi:adenylyltransferase/sulfurtransferase